MEFNDANSVPVDVIFHSRVRNEARSTTGMGLRSWRRSLYVEDGVILKMFAEPGLRDSPPGVPVEVSDAGTMLDDLRTHADQGLKPPT